MSSTLFEQLKILLVDDNRAARRVVEKHLRRLGCNEIVSASNGAEAFEVLKGGQVDLVLSDWEMPEMDGLEFLRVVRKDPEISRLPFVMMTSIAEKERVMTAFDSGVSDYLIKPFSVEVLGDKLASVMASEDTGAAREGLRDRVLVDKRVK